MVNENPPSRDKVEMAKKIRNKLVIDERKLFDEILEKSSKYIQIDSKGNVYVKSPDAMRNIDAIALYLLGKRLALDAGLGKSDLVEAEEVARAVGVKKAVAAARLHELMTDLKAENPERGKFRVIMARAHSILTDVEAIARKGGAAKP